MNEIAVRNRKCNVVVSRADMRKILEAASAGASLCAIGVALGYTATQGTSGASRAIANFFLKNQDEWMWR
jgi:hypothetical protein